MKRVAIKCSENSPYVFLASFEYSQFHDFERLFWSKTFKNWKAYKNFSSLCQDKAYSRDLPNIKMNSHVYALVKKDQHSNFLSHKRYNISFAETWEEVGSIHINSCAYAMHYPFNDGKSEIYDIEEQIQERRTGIDKFGRAVYPMEFIIPEEIQQAKEYKFLLHITKDLEVSIQEYPPYKECPVGKKQSDGYWYFTDIESAVKYAFAILTKKHSRNKRKKWVAKKEKPLTEPFWKIESDKRRKEEKKKEERRRATEQPFQNIKTIDYTAYCGPSSFIYNIIMQCLEQDEINKAKII